MTTLDRTTIEGFNSLVGEKIKCYRMINGWTQADIAKSTALSPNYVARLERGELCPSLLNAQRLAEALGVSVDKISVPIAAARQGRPKPSLPRRRVRKRSVE